MDKNLQKNSRDLLMKLLTFILYFSRGFYLIYFIMFKFLIYLIYLNIYFNIFQYNE